MINFEAEAIFSGNFDDLFKVVYSQFQFDST